MKKSLSICAFSIFLLAATSLEAQAQRRGRGSRSGGVRNAPARTAPTTRRTTPRVRRSTPSNPRRTRVTPTPRTRNPRTTSGYNTPRRTGPRYNPNRNHPARRTTRYTRYNHSPYRHNYVQRRHYLRTSNYAQAVRRYNSNYFYRNWIFYPSTRTNGYYVIDNYPYFIFNGYRHRYSNMDICDYQLVDSYTDTVIRYYNNRTCSYGYDECARERDYQNDYEYGNRYFCAESYQF